MSQPAEPRDFIRQRIAADLASDAPPERIVTRFPPEPNGYLHIGHAKAVCLNFGVAAEFDGVCNLRFDDTNPLKESQAFVDAIQQDVRWLGFEWAELRFTSDYFERLYEIAVALIEQELAYVDSQSAEEIRLARGTLTEPGTDSPHRTRTVAQNLDLFARMRAGEFPDGAHVLRARIDMSAGNINLRDPVLYRILHARHHRTGDAWCIYPTYDFAHPLSDAIEGITHSICTLEFEDHRPLYDWLVEHAGLNAHPQQIEFSRLGLEHTVMSKRLLARLVEEGHVAGWDDPRMPTIAGLRRRGYTAAAIRDFCERVGVTKQDNTVEMELLEFCVRQDLEHHARRALVVLEPLKVTITNYPDGGSHNDGEVLEAPWHPKQELGTRQLPFGPELYVERGDYTDTPPNRKYKGLAPDAEVRLRYAYIIRCDEVVRDDAGEAIELRCTYFPDSRSGSDTSGRKPKGVLHWVDARTARPVEVNLYGHLLREPQYDGARELAEQLNPDSLHRVAALAEPALADARPGDHFQFERTGYFVADPGTTGAGPVFNRTATLRDARR